MEKPTPEPILKTALGFMAAKFLFVANELDLFEALAGGPASLDQLARRTGVPHRTLRIVADAVASLGLLEREEDRYRNSEVAAAFLGGARDTGMRPVLRLFDRISYRNWLDLESAVRGEGGHTIWGRMQEEDLQIASAGISALTAPVATALAENYDFARHRRLLDLGGGTGNFLVAILARYPGLAGILFELPDTAAVARRAIGERPEMARIEIAEGNLFTDALPEGADAVLIANLAHLFAPARNLDMLRRVRRHAAAGARLLFVDFWTVPSHTGPPPAPLMAGEFLLFAGEGDVYSAEECEGWLRETGWRPIERKPLAGPQSLVVAEAA